MNKTPVEYTPSTHAAQAGKRKIVVRSLTPKLSEEKQKDVKKDIEKSLYEVFCKYMV